MSEDCSSDASVCDAPKEECKASARCVCASGYVNDGNGACVENGKCFTEIKVTDVGVSSFIYLFCLIKIAFYF